MRRISTIIVFSLIFLLPQWACGPDTHSSAKGNAGEWLIKGQVQNADFAGGEVVAYNSAGTAYSSRLVEKEFALFLPEADHYAFFFVKNGKEAPKSSKSGASDNFVGREFASLVFEKDPQTNRLAKLLTLPHNAKNEIVDLGEVEIRRGTAFPENNPAQYLDNDGDHINDYFDIDHNGDGWLDSEQPLEHKELDICHVGDGPNIALRVSLVNIMEHKSHGDYTGPCQMSAKPRMPSIGGAAPQNTQPQVASNTSTQPSSTSEAPKQPTMPKPEYPRNKERKEQKQKQKHKNDDGETEEEKEEGDGKKKGKKKKKGGKKESDGCDEDKKNEDDQDPDETKDSNKRKDDKKDKNQD